MRLGAGVEPEPGRHGAAGAALRGGRLPHRAAGGGRARRTDQGGLSDQAEREPGRARHERGGPAGADDPPPAAGSIGPPAAPGHPTERQGPHPDGAPRAAAENTRGSCRRSDEAIAQGF